MQRWNNLPLVKVYLIELNFKIHSLVRGAKIVSKAEANGSILEAKLCKPKHPPHPKQFLGHTTTKVKMPSYRIGQIDLIDSAKLHYRKIRGYNYKLQPLNGIPYPPP